MNFFMENHCEFVAGAKCASIYDLKNKKVYALNASGKSIVESALIGECPGDDKSEQYLAKLVSMNLLTSKMPDIEPTIPPILPRLSYAWLELTSACNLKCVHCYGSFGHSSTPESFYMSTRDWKNVIRKLIRLDCSEIQLIGGEPLAFSGLTEILYYAHKVGMKRIDVFSNGTLLDDDKLNAIKTTGANMRVSLYGHNAEVHESVTLQNGSFEQLDRTLKTLKRHDIPTNIAVILMKENENFISQIRHYIESLGHKYSGYDTIRATSPVLKKHWVSNLQLLQEKYKIKADFSTNATAFNNNKKWNSCWFGKIAITATGDILPCIFAREQIVGNVIMDSIKNIRNKLLPLWGITKDNVRECRDCEFRYACHDCRPLAIGLGGDIGAKNPRCCYSPECGEWKDISEVSIEVVR